ncbi:MAG: amidohydrolase family protein [Cytophagales bacterium]|nr:amidohydrolase family protein [Cytophagales bacterium]
MFIRVFVPISFLIVFTAVLPLSLNAQRIAIKAGHLFDTQTGKFVEDQVILIEKGVIVEVYGQSQSEKAGEIIDLSDSWVMPGFIDVHVHLESQSSPNTYLDRFRKNEADRAYDAAVYARRTLMAGFTTVRDLGGTGVNTALSRAIQMGKAEGPTVYSAGKSIATTGGHADPTNGFRADLIGDPGPKEGVINGREEARKAVRQRYKNGAHCIKITATGGVLSLAKSGMAPQFTMDELEGIIEAANDLDMVTAAHAHGAEGMKRAVLAGINSIEHGSVMSEEVMDLMIERGTYYVPTLSAGVFTVEKADVPGYYPEIVIPKAKYVGAQMKGTFKKAYDKGVRIAFGTDSGVSPHGENAKEFQYMVEAGMTPEDALKSATIEAATLLRIQDRIGSLEKDFSADIVAVRENPVENIKILQEVSFVMKEGKVYKRK